MDLSGTTWIGLIVAVVAGGIGAWLGSVQARRRATTRATEIDAADTEAVALERVRYQLGSRERELRKIRVNLENSTERLEQLAVKLAQREADLSARDTELHLARNHERNAIADIGVLRARVARYEASLAEQDNVLAELSHHLHAVRERMPDRGAEIDAILSRIDVLDPLLRNLRAAVEQVQRPERPDRTGVA